MPFANYNLSDLYLKASAWFVSRKPFFRKWWVILIIAANALMIVYVVTSLLLFAFEAPRYDQAVVQLTNNFISLSQREAAKPQPIEIMASQATSSRTKSYDLSAKVKNANSQWMAKSLKYRFVVDGIKTEEFSAYVLPNEEKYLVNQNFSYSGAAFPEKVEVEVSGTEWQRLSDLSLLSKIKFRVENISLSQSEVTAGSGAASTLSAEITNDSIFGFWRVEIPIVILSGDRVIAVNSYTIREFKSDETKKISVSWQREVPSAGKTEIQPQVNILEANNFISP